MVILQFQLDLYNNVYIIHLFVFSNLNLVAEVPKYITEKHPGWDGSPSQNTIYMKFTDGEQWWEEIRELGGNTEKKRTERHRKKNFCKT